MPLFVYRCPTTGHHVQDFSANDVSTDTGAYETVLCAMCQRYHAVNPATGEVLGQDTEQTSPRDRPSRQST
jgi:hypothetical protein